MRTLEVPCSSQNPGRDVEQSSALEVARVRIVEQGRSLGIDIDWRMAGKSIDPADDAVAEVARVFLLDALDLRDCRACRMLRLVLRICIKLDFVFARHGKKGEAEQAHGISSRGA